MNLKPETPYLQDMNWSLEELGRKAEDAEDCQQTPGSDARVGLRVKLRV